MYTHAHTYKYTYSYTDTYFRNHKITSISQISNFIILRFILAFPQSSFVPPFFHRETLCPKNLNIFVHFFNPVIHLK